jgi:hypothetical protein
VRVNILAARLCANEDAAACLSLSHRACSKWSNCSSRAPSKRCPKATASQLPTRLSFSNKVIASKVAEFTVATLATSCGRGMATSSQSRAHPAAIRLFKGLLIPLVGGTRHRHVVAMLRCPSARPPSAGPLRRTGVARAGPVAIRELNIIPNAVAPISPLDIPSVLLRALTRGVSQLTDVSNSYKRGALRIFEDQTAADRDIEWVSVAFFILFCLILVDGGLRAVKGALDAKEEQDSAGLPDERSADTIDSADERVVAKVEAGEEMLPAVGTVTDPAEVLRLERVLLVDAEQAADREATLTLLAVAWFIFASGGNAFLRTPELPLQP